MIRFCSRYVVPKIRIVRVPTGNAGTLASARIIADLMQQGARDFYVRQKAIDIFRYYGVPAKDRWGEACALYDWVKRNVRYTRDIFRVETLHSARRTLETRAADCDDFTILLGAMLLSTGHPVRIVLTGFRPHKPHAYSHIYPEVFVLGRWVPVDATVRHPIGWAPPAIWKSVCEIGKEGFRCSSRTC
jgi:transglutaminase-like putative cysteine protease